MENHYFEWEKSTINGHFQGLYMSLPEGQHSFSENIPSCLACAQGVLPAFSNGHAWDVRGQRPAWSPAGWSHGPVEMVDLAMEFVKEKP